MQLTLQHTLTFSSGNKLENCRSTFDLTSLRQLVGLYELINNPKYSNFKIISQ